MINFIQLLNEFQAVLGYNDDQMSAYLGVGKTVYREGRNGTEEPPTFAATGRDGRNDWTERVRDHDGGLHGRRGARVPDRRRRARGGVLAGPRRARGVPGAGGVAGASRTRGDLAP